MSIPIKITCPLGSDCEELKGGELRRCRWYVRLTGKNPQSEEMIDRWDCAMAWMPVMMVENAQTNRGQTAALESFRNEMVVGQREFTTALSVAAAQSRGLIDG